MGKFKQMTDEKIIPWLTYRYYSPGVRFHGALTKELNGFDFWESAKKIQNGNLKVSETYIELHDEQGILGAASLEFDEGLLKAINQRIKTDSESDHKKFIVKFIRGKFEHLGDTKNSQYVRYYSNKSDFIFCLCRKYRNDLPKGVELFYDKILLDGGLNGYIDSTYKESKDG